MTSAAAASLDQTSPRHSLADDVLGLVTGAFVASLGLHLLKVGGVVTGGTAGVALLVTQLTGLPFGVLYFAINTPFFALAIWKSGWDFTIRTVIAVGLTSLFATVHQAAVPGLQVPPLYAAITGNLVVGIAILILFRHRSSLGGFTTAAAMVQQRFGLRAGHLMLALDTLVLLVSLLAYPPLGVAISAAGVLILNVIIAMNHRPGRYLGA